MKFIVYFLFGFLVATYFPDFIPFIKSAETSAKENILRSTVPEILKKNAEQNCNITVGEKPKEFEPPKPLAVPTIPVQIAPLINQNGSTQQNSEGFLCC